MRAALDAFEDETELLLERANLQVERAMAWSYLRYLDIAASAGRDNTMKRLIPAFVAVLVFGGALGYGLTRWLEKEPAAATDSGRKILYWHDPDGPNVKFDKPGKSPFMDMQLVPVYADEANGDGAGEGECRCRAEPWCTPR